MLRSESDLIYLLKAKLSAIEQRCKASLFFQFFQIDFDEIVFEPEDDTKRDLKESGKVNEMF